ncbi:MAG: hypothetical protein U0931_35975 [Vulcanimicrobiota bacterium]
MYTDADIQSRMDKLKLECERKIVSRVSRLLDSEAVEPYQVKVRVDPVARTRISIEIQRVMLSVNLVGSKVDPGQASVLMKKIVEVAEIQQMRGDAVTIHTNPECGCQSPNSQKSPDTACL